MSPCRTEYNGDGDDWKRQKKEPSAISEARTIVESRSREDQVKRHEQLGKLQEASECSNRLDVYERVFLDNSVRAPKISATLSAMNWDGMTGGCQRWSKGEFTFGPNGEFVQSQ